MSTYTQQSLVKMQRTASAKQEEFKALVKNLKKKKPKEIDGLFHNLHHSEFEKIDCLECANCCKTLGPILFQSDIERMAKRLKLKTSAFYDNYVKTDEDGDMVFNAHPCPMLMPDNYCMVYENRPKACREYPHTDRKRMRQILNKTLKNASFCPAVFNILEQI